MSDPLRTKLTPFTMPIATNFHPLVWTRMVWTDTTDENMKSHIAMSDLLRARLKALPRHRLVNLVDRFERWQPGTDADDEYVKWSDVQALLREPPAAAPLDAAWKTVMVECVRAWQDWLADKNSTQKLQRAIRITNTIRIEPETAAATPLDAEKLLKRYLDNHCQAADQEGMSVLCECRLCKDTRVYLGMPTWEAARATAPEAPR
jgi:hypothetical protein